MTKKLLAGTVLALSCATLAACSPVETKTSLVTPVSAQTLSAGPGDVVLDFKSKRSLPNAFGKADLFGRTTNAGRTTVRYIGSQGGQAVFERNDIMIDSDATTMSETPLILPSTTSTTVYGTVGGTPVSGTANSTSYQYIPPRGSTQYATAARPIQFTLGSGQSIKVSGRTLKVVRVAPASVEYRID